MNRERHRKNQERYRLRQKKLTNNLDHANQLLRDEIRYLKSQRNRLIIGISPHITLQTVVMEYFRVFRHGFVDPDGSRIVELDFLRASMSPDLDAGAVFGFEALARNWGIFSLFFRNVRVQLEGMEQTGENAVVAKTITSVTITTTSLREVFSYPGTVERERWSKIVAKLLGQRLVMHGSVQFIWNSLTNRMEGLLSQSDMVTPLLQLLGSMEDVSVVLSKARVTPEGNLVVGDYLSRYPSFS
ncbi:hypothetical protein PHMEG_00018639 [Phytophthora megakarya]|uniref:Bzip transcription factor n=1 Tax=Phytophthora megakarya TaxID=4795 RepID=A0A225VUE7_9STRA|nr:hypothetical protein PHMEG_00018639 [Phytophthora megakarya]